MHKLIVALTLTAINAVSFATTVGEDIQDRAYTQCMIKRRVDPTNISREDNEVCMLEAGIEDPGEAARKLTGEAWRTCIIRKAVELDDGISAVNDIAKAIISNCPDEWRAYVGAMAMPPTSKKKMAGGLQVYGVGEGVQAVQLERRVAREAAKK